MTSPYRLALCTTELRPGGAERCLVQLATRIDRDRFAPAVYVLSGTPPRDQALLVNVLRDAEIPLTFLGAQGILAAPRAYRELSRLWRNPRPHVVQTFLFHANLLGRFAARAAGVRHMACGLRVAERRKRWHLALDRLTSRLVESYVCVSDDVAEFAGKNGVARRKLVVIPNGIDIDEAVAPADLRGLGVSGSRRAICYVGRFDRQKRVDWLLHALAARREVFAHHDLLLVGSGPDHRSIIELIAALKLTDYVRVVTWQSSARAIVAASDLLLLPSAWEGMPNVVLEAMAAERPVVSTDVEGVRQLLGPGSASQVVGRDDPRGFASQVLSLLNDRERSAALGAANRRRAASHFSLSAMIEAYQSLYERLLAESRSD